MLEAEVEDYLTRHRAARDEHGRAQVVRHGTAPARQLVTGSGTLQVRAPRISSRRCRYCSARTPRGCRPRRSRG
jgi:hypothetical protein